VVGSLPTTNGMSATAQAGCLLVLDRWGHVRETISGNGINGPWDMTAISSRHFAELFVTNVLNGTVAANGSVVNQGTVLRLGLALHGRHAPHLVGVTTIGSGFGERTDPAALVVGPTGVGLNSRGTLYVADSVGNRVTAIPGAPFRHTSAGTGSVVTSGGALNTPLGLTVTPRGDVLTVNGGDGRLVETTPAGTQVATRFLDKSGSPKGAGALFGLAVAPFASGLYYVDDAVNTLRLLH
jgi:sugar lactone lactonase YvrE